MRRKNHGTIVGHFVELVDEHGAEPPQPLDHETVVDDLVPHVDRRSEPLEREFDDLDRTVDSGAEAARRRDQDTKGEAVGHAAAM
jgi:hypothetical protein